MDQQIDEDPMTQVWLNGTRYNEAYLYDTLTGNFRYFSTPQPVGMTAGNGGKIGCRFVATYVATDGYQIIIQIGRHQYPVDDATSVQASIEWSGLSSILIIARHGLPTQRLRLWTIGRWASRRLNPTWDGLDEMMADRAAGIASLSSSVEAQETFRNVKSPSAGPWHIVESPSQ